MKKKIFNRIIGTVCIIFVAWFVISWVEVFSNNMTPDYEYNSFNLFNLFSSII